MNIEVSSPSTLAAYTDYIASCAFLHDDWLPAEGLHDWGQYDTNPFLLGSQVCVVNSIRGFGPQYLDYLRDLQSYPQVVIIPHPATQDLTYNLLHDPYALACLKEVMQDRGLNLSCFYPNRFHAELTRALDLPEMQTELYPCNEQFTQANTIAGGLNTFTRAGVPTPEFRICRNMAELRDFARQPRAYRELILKCGHRKNRRCLPENLEQTADQLSFPLVAETWYPQRRSPSVNGYAGHPGISLLFSTQQFLRNNMNWGNDTGVDIPSGVHERIFTYTRQIANVLGQIEGVFGVDYVETETGEILAVDLNPRFCSPTYPFTFLQRMGFHLEHTYAHYRVVPCTLDALSDLLDQPEFLPIEPGCRAGMFVFNPVVYHNGPQAVEYCSYVVASDDPQHLTALETRLLGLLGQASG